MKKVISSIIASAVAVSTLGVSAFAAVPAAAKLDSSTKTYDISAGLNGAEITASIPTEIKAVINPYNAIITDSVYGSSFASGVASPTYQIINGMADKLAVTATPTITSSKTVEISETPLAENLVDKTVFAYLNTTTLEDTGAPIFRNTHYDENDSTQAVFKEEGEAKANIMIIGSTSDASQNGYFRVEGECTQKPEEAWNAKDTVKLGLVLDLAPSAGAVKDTSASALTVTGPTLVETFDTALTNYTAKIAATPNSFGGAITLKDADAFKTGGTGKVLVFFNGTALATQPTVTTNAVTIASFLPTGVTSYKVGDIVEIVVASGIYSTTYTITIVE